LVLPVQQKFLLLVAVVAVVLRAVAVVLVECFTNLKRI
jgi:hypothetical protein